MCLLPAEPGGRGDCGCLGSEAGLTGPWPFPATPNFGSDSDCFSPRNPVNIDDPSGSGSRPFFQSSFPGPPSPGLTADREPVYTASLHGQGQAQRGRDVLVRTAQPRPPDPETPSERRGICLTLAEPRPPRPPMPREDVVVRQAGLHPARVGLRLENLSLAL